MPSDSNAVTAFMVILETGVWSGRPDRSNLRSGHRGPRAGQRFGPRSILSSGARFVGHGARKTREVQCDGGLADGLSATFRLSATNRQSWYAEGPYAPSPTTCTVTASPSCMTAQAYS